ncbi:hypothetical protein CALVIDRAFT_17087 [Calocera viscosa TUFC12733]|uniref:Uncharacterized protein n=1 Tax=Calocera viscosa (strain TUFC12733) TaxID=1330018 RepID=A0A167SAT1_CALVF|nr:hypothetical protein CALVIDRAFT_17087 [Calocera viscosa TUFC12733]
MASFCAPGRSKDRPLELELVRHTGPLTCASHSSLRHAPCVLPHPASIQHLRPRVPTLPPDVAGRSSYVLSVWHRAPLGIQPRKPMQATASHRLPWSNSSTPRHMSKSMSASLSPGSHTPKQTPPAFRTCVSPPQAAASYSTSESQYVNISTARFSLLELSSTLAAPTSGRRSSATWTQNRA